MYVFFYFRVHKNAPSEGLRLKNFLAREGASPSQFKAVRQHIKVFKDAIRTEAEHGPILRAA